MKLYEVATQYRSALAALEDTDIPAEAIADTLEALQGDLEVKAMSVAAYFENLTAEVAAMKSAEKRIADRRKALESKIDRGREYLKSNMEACGITEIKGPELLLRIRKNPPSVFIDNESELPEACFRIKREPDKTKIKAMLDSGEIINGARLEQSTRLEVK